MDEKIEVKANKELYNDLSSIMSEEYEKRMLITPSYCANKLLEKGYRKESDTARECLEQFICRLVNARLFGVNDDLYYELLETKDDLLKEKYGVDLGE